MSKRRVPYFRFDVTDWLTSVDIIRMSLAEVGAYINLLARAWEQNPIATLPNDPDKLWKLSGARTRAEFDAVAPAVLAMFKVDGDRLVNERLRQELENVVEKTSAARKAANSRWGRVDDNLDDVPSMQPHANACTTERTEDAR